VNQIRRISLSEGGRKKRSGTSIGLKITVANAAPVAKPLTAGSMHDNSGVANCVLAVVVRFTAIAGPEPHESLFGVDLSGSGFEFPALR
jgi:hypothetical protein